VTAELASARATCAEPTLILPIENQVRELDAKLLLGCVAAERGFSVVLGSRNHVHFRVHAVPEGIYLAKSMRVLSERMFSILEDLGHRIVAWDEEGLVRFPSPDYYRRRLAEKAFRRTSLLFAWGEDDAEAFERFPGYHGAPIHVTGNPRGDLLRPELRPYFDEDVAALRRRHGPFVLINTNFGFVNHFVPSLNLVQVRRDGSAVLGGNTRDMTPEFASGIAAHKRALFDAFRGAVPALAAAFPGRAIVVRPHPAESPAPWIEAARGFDHVHVGTEGNVLPWLRAASVLVHNGCTTAVEAATLGTPTVAYRPVRSERFDFPLPNSLGHTAEDDGQLVALAAAALEGRLRPLDEAERRRILRRHLASLDGPLASDRIVDVLEGPWTEAASTGAPSPGRRMLAVLRNRIRTGRKRLNARRTDHRNGDALHAHRFPELDVEGLAERIARLSRCLGRFDGLRVEEIARHVFRIERATRA
jgi:surface carbohydrate biosynthesis protein